MKRQITAALKISKLTDLDIFPDTTFEACMELGFKAIGGGFYADVILEGPNMYAFVIYDFSDDTFQYWEDVRSEDTMLFLESIASGEDRVDSEEYGVFANRFSSLGELLKMSLV